MPATRPSSAPRRCDARLPAPCRRDGFHVGHVYEAHKSCASGGLSGGGNPPERREDVFARRGARARGIRQAREGPSDSRPPRIGGMGRPARRDAARPRGASPAEPCVTLVDTSIWIEVFRRNRPLDLTAQVPFDDVVTCLPVIQEVLQGMREERAYRIARDAMLALPIVEDPLGNDLILEAAGLYRTARARGLTIRSSV